MGLIINDEREGEGKDDLEFSILFQESKRGGRISSEDRKRKKTFRMGHGLVEVLEMLDLVSSWKFGSGV